MLDWHGCGRSWFQHQSPPRDVTICRGGRGRNDRSRRCVTVPECVHSRLTCAFKLVLATLVAAIVIVQPRLSVPASAAQPETAGMRKVWVNATGQTMTGAFLEYWINNPEIGNPVSGPVMVGDLWSQWFEYARLELEPGPFELATAENVRLHQIGRSFATKAGYSDGLSAFRPLAEGQDRFFPETGHTLTMGFRSAYEQPGVGERLGLPISEEFNIGDITYQFFEYGAFCWGPSAVAELVPLGRLDAGIQGQLAQWEPKPWDAIDWDSTDLIELSDLLPGERSLEVDLSDFTLTARVGDKIVLQSIISIGMPEAPTVTGRFSIYLKYEIQSLSGIGWDGQPFAAPDTKWVMYFYEDYGFHSSNWRTEYGLMDSQGCVVSPMDVAEKIWRWADYGTPVWVHE